MSDAKQEDFLARVASLKAELAKSAAKKTEMGCDEVATLDPESNDAGSPSEGDLEGLLSRINQLTSGVAEEMPAACPPKGAAPKKASSPAVVTAGANPAKAPAESEEAFVPLAPRSFAEAQLTPSAIEELILKFLMARGEESGTGIATQVRLPFSLISDLLGRMKYDQLIGYRNTTSLNDYVCQLTDIGRERARRLNASCTYFGAAPVSLQTYSDAIRRQSLQTQSPGVEDLTRAFSDLLINPKMLTRLGAAVNSGRGMFLYGYPGNGKTSIAERVTKAFGEYIWIPRAIGVDGEIIRLFDPSQHEVAPQQISDGIVVERQIDARWVQIRRPTIIVGGELTMDNLELTVNHASGINEAPVQLKSNCGTLVIDDFGRQRMSTDELLNRWIVPLEKRFDYLNLPSGKKIEVPFDQLVIFSTNLEPKDLVDDAFLRRIPYKIEVENPSEAEFRKLFQIMCPIMGFEYDDRAINYLIEKHYKPTDRPYRCCHPRDLLMQVQNFCKFTRSPRSLNPKTIDFACSNYFAVM
ncbi:MAG: AAA family ATPase [Pirellulaceae bacterium]